MKIVIKNISTLLKQHAITPRDQNLINQRISQQIHSSQSINSHLEKYIETLLKKYDISYVDIYSLNSKIWIEITKFKFNNQKIINSVRYKM